MGLHSKIRELACNKPVAPSLPSETGQEEGRAMAKVMGGAMTAMFVALALLDWVTMKM
jgi:hypothetical protein